MTANDLSITRKDLVPCSLLVILPLFLFRDILFGGHTLFGADFVQIHLHTKQFLYTEMANHGSIPSWNPFIFSGIPFWAHFESTVFYPLGVLFWIMPPEKAYGYTMFMHLVLAGLFMYLLARSFRFSRPGAFVAAVIYTFNGFILATLYDGQLYRIQTYTWIPLIIYFLNRALTLQTRLFNATMAGMIWGIQILAGAPQDAFYTLLGAMIFLGCDLLQTLKDLHRSLSTLAIALLLFAVGLGVAAIQLVPASEFVRLSVRAALNSYDLVTLGSYPPEGVITALLPHFFGDYGKETFWVSGLPWSIPLYNLYVGIPSIMLLFFISYRHPDNKKIIVFSVSLACFALILAFGKHTPIYRLVYLLPGFDKIRAPAKIIILWAFAFALLAGKGTDDLLMKSKTDITRRLRLPLCFLIALAFLDLLFHIDRSTVLKCFSPFILEQAIPNRLADARTLITGEFHRLTILSASTLLLIYLWTRVKSGTHLFVTLFCGILILDLGYTNWRAVRHKDEVYLWTAQAKKALHETLGKDDSVYRVGSFKFGMGANLDMYLGYQSVGGYGPLCLHRYYEYINHYRFYKTQVPQGWIIFFYEAHENSILMDLLNVKYEISHATKSYAPRNTYLPRAFIVPDYKLIPKEEVLNYLIRPDFDPTKLVLFESEDHPFDQPKHPPPSQATQSHVEIISYRPDSMVLETNSSAAGFLFLSEIYYPGWKALVDGQPTRILRGNYLFRVIEVPEGRHTVQLVFEPLSIKLGIGITLLTVLLILAMPAYRRLKRKTPRL